MVERARFPFAGDLQDHEHENDPADHRPEKVTFDSLHQEIADDHPGERRRQHAPDMPPLGVPAKRGGCKDVAANQKRKHSARGFAGRHNFRHEQHGDRSDAGKPALCEADAESRDGGEPPLVRGEMRQGHGLTLYCHGRFWIRAPALSLSPTFTAAEQEQEKAQE